jgi:chromosomal replication initiator protein
MSFGAVSTQSKNTVARITLEKPASIRRQFPCFKEQGWMLSEYIYGDENAGLTHLFNPTSLARLHELSPVVLYGEKATGKTALAITLAVCWARHTNLRPLCFATGQSFSSDYAEAVEIDDVASFRTRYRQCKLLIIDDLEPICGKPAALRELIHTADQLLQAQAPMIVTCGKLPASLPAIDPALASRLSAGYSTCLRKPGPAAQRAVFDALIRDIDPQLNADELADFCRRFTKPLSALDLLHVVMVAHQNKASNGSFDYDVVSLLVGQLLAGKGLSIASIARSVAKKMRIRLSDLRGSTRQANVVRARGLAMLLARRLTPASLQQIGQFFGGRDHSTVLHACRKTAALVGDDTELSKLMADLQAELLA